MYFSLPCSVGLCTSSFSGKLNQFGQTLVASWGKICTYGKIIIFWQSFLPWIQVKDNKLFMKVCAAKDTFGVNNPYRVIQSSGVPGFFRGWGLNKFSWEQRAERTGIWGRNPPSRGFHSICKWVKPVFWLSCYGCIFHGTGNSAQLCQNFGISGGGGVFEPPTPLCTPPTESYK
jgi:hypothetical protein